MKRNGFSGLTSNLWWVFFLFLLYFCDFIFLFFILSCSLSLSLLGLSITEMVEEEHPEEIEMMRTE
jgi:hypothetical protein